MDYYLIRHPEPLEAEGYCYGQRDLPLAAPAAQAANALRPRLPARFDLISSPLTRCRQLAEQLAPRPRLEPRLMEMHFGRWEGQRWDAIDRAQLDAWADDLLGFVPPGGESVAALFARAQDFAASLAPSLQQVAIITHAGVMRSLVGHWQQLPAAEWSQLQFAYGEIVPILVSETTVRP